MQAFPVEVEVNVGEYMPQGLGSPGMPDFVVVGLPDAAVRESRDRVKTALFNSGYLKPPGKITVNLAPADLRKEGPSFDLAIALGILTASDQCKPPATRDGRYLAVGELALTGAVRRVKGVLPIALMAKQSGYAAGQVDIGFLRTPVCSDVIYSYGPTGNQTFKYQTVQSDAKLAEVIAAIDSGAASLAGVDPAEFAAIKKIRSFTYSEGCNSVAVIPPYGKAKEAAKKFLLYLASDEAQQIYYNENGCKPPYDVSGITLSSNPTTLQANVAKAVENVTYVSTRMPKHPLFYATEMSFVHMNCEASLGTTSTTDKKTAVEFWQDSYDYYSRNFDAYLALANLK